MSIDKDMGIRLVLALMLTAVACEQKHGLQVNPNLLKSASGRFETITEAPTTLSDNVVEEDKAKDSDSTPEERPKDKNETPPPKIRNTPKDVPAPSNVNGAQTPSWPPTATDDDLAGPDHIFGGGPGKYIGAGPPVVPYARCGDGIRQPLEECDLGAVFNATNAQGCNLICGKPYCGNGVTEPFAPPITTPPQPVPGSDVKPDEQCDDGNNENGDGCSARCQFEVCGNFRLDPGEQCDDGNKTNGDGCSACCLYEECGNGTIDSGEQCDDGNKVNGDGCSDCCKRET